MGENKSKGGRKETRKDESWSRKGSVWIGAAQGCPASSPDRPSPCGEVIVSRGFSEPSSHFYENERHVKRLYKVLISQKDSRILRPLHLTPLILGWIQVQRPKWSPDFAFSQAWIIQQMVGAHLEMSRCTLGATEAPEMSPAQLSCHLQGVAGGPGNVCVQVFWLQGDVVLQIQAILEEGALCGYCQEMKADTGI